MNIKSNFMSKISIAGFSIFQFIFHDFVAKKIMINVGKNYF